MPRDRQQPGDAIPPVTMEDEPERFVQQFLRNQAQDIANSRGRTGNLTKRKTNKELARRKSIFIPILEFHAKLDRDVALGRISEKEARAQAQAAKPEMVDFILKSKFFGGNVDQQRKELARKLRITQSELDKGIQMENDRKALDNAKRLRVLLRTKRFKDGRPDIEGPFAASGADEQIRDRLFELQQVMSQRALQAGRRLRPKPDNPRLNMFGNPVIKENP